MIHIDQKSYYYVILFECTTYVQVLLYICRFFFQFFYFNFNVFMFHILYFMQLKFQSLYSIVTIFPRLLIFRLLYLIIICFCFFVLFLAVFIQFYSHYSLKPFIHLFIFFEKKKNLIMRK